MTTTPELNGHRTDAEPVPLHDQAYGDRQCALIALLAANTHDADLRELVAVMMRDEATDPVAVVMNLLLYATRVNPYIRTEGTRRNIIKELDDLRASMLLADELTRWRTR